MAPLFNLINQITDIIILPFPEDAAVVNLAFLSLCCAFAVMVAFKRISNQEKIKYHQRKIFGFIFEMAIFRDQFSRIIANQVQIVKHNFIYLRYVLPPFIIIAIPVGLVCLQIENHLGHFPLSVNDHFILQAELDHQKSSDLKSDLFSVQCNTPPGVILETEPVRILSEAKVYWRGKIITPEPQTVSIGIKGVSPGVEKKIATPSSAGGFSRLRTKTAFLGEYIMNTAEKPIPADSPIKTIAINYRNAAYPFLCWQLSPVVYFFILSLVIGLILKPFLKVNI
jgi:hypothetical protein